MLTTCNQGQIILSSRYRRVSRVANYRCISADSEIKTIGAQRNRSRRARCYSAPIAVMNSSRALRARGGYAKSRLSRGAGQ